MKANMKGGMLKAKYDVGIVGSGPVGLVLSGLLKRCGIRHALIDRRKDPVVHPQAHFLNARSMEIAQSYFPSEYSDIVNMLPDSKYWRDFSYCHTLTGTELHRVNQFQRTDNVFWRSTPSNVAHLAQNKFETIFRSVGSRETSAEALVSMYRGYSVKGCTYTPESATVRAESSFPDNVHSAIELECKYLIGADGASSTVRNSLDIAMQGKEEMQHLVNVHFSCPGLRALLRPRPAMLYFTFHENLVAVFVAHDALSDEWVCQIPYFPPFQDRKDFTEEVVRKLISSGIGASSLPLKIMSINSWVMHAQVAAKYGNTADSRDSRAKSNSHYTKNFNNVFLVGDAAHRFPPSGGFGMNTGIQDAHNLAWKLALVLKGKADPKILSETYEKERKPAAEYITALSLYNYSLSAGAATALGVDPALATAAVTAANSATLVPFAVRRAAVLKAFEAGSSTLRWLKDWENNMLGGVRVRALQKRLDSGKSLPLIFPQVDLEYKYTQGGVVVEQASPVRRHGSGTTFTGLHLQVGARLPHFWLRPHLTADRDATAAHLTVSSVQLPALIDTFDAVSSENGASTPSVLLMLDSAYAEQAVAALQQLDPSVQRLFRVISVSSTPTTLTTLKEHLELQQQFQIPHFVIGEDELTREVKNEHSFHQRFASVRSGQTLPDWTKSDSHLRPFEFQCSTGRWQGMNQSYLKHHSHSESNAEARSVAVIVRPDGHVAHIVCAEEKLSESERTERYKEALCRVVDALHLI